MVHKFDPSQKKLLESAEREGLFDAARALLDLGLKKGMIAADVGCGTGFFTRKMSAVVGDAGKVFAMDISKEMLAELRRQLRINGIKNVEAMKSGENELPLTDNLIDFCLLSLLVHELLSPEEFFEEIKRILKPTGIIGIIEWEKVESPLGPPLTERISEIEMKKILEESGARVEKSKSLGPYNYLIAANLPPRQ